MIVPVRNFFILAQFWKHFRLFKCRRHIWCSRCGEEKEKNPRKSFVNGGKRAGENHIRSHERKDLIAERRVQGYGGRKKPRLQRELTIAEQEEAVARLIALKNYLFSLCSGDVASQLFSRAGFDPVDRNKAATYVRREAERVRAPSTSDRGYQRPTNEGSYILPYPRRVDRGLEEFLRYRDRML